MSLRRLTKIAIVFLGACQAAGAQPTREPHTSKRAQAKVTVQSSETIPYDQATSPTLSEVHITEAFAGDIEAESTVRALQIQRENHSANLVSMQRVRGKLGGREGAFVLQGAETVENGRIKATWSVVPGSGTGGLTGLRGEGGFEGQFGKATDAWLNYWFE